MSRVEPVAHSVSFVANGLELPPEALGVPFPSA